MHYSIFSHCLGIYIVIDRSINSKCMYMYIQTVKSELVIVQFTVVVMFSRYCIITFRN